MSQKIRFDLLKTLTMKDLKEICKNNGLKGYSGYKMDELCEFASKNLKFSTKQMKILVQKLQEDKSVSKVKDSEDYVLRKAVNIESFEDDQIIATVDNLNVKINNLGTEDFSYFCDGKCKDYIYRVKHGKSPFVNIILLL